MPTIASKCESVITCDIHYKLDWSYLARISDYSCSLAIENDPCFGSHACLCNNGYFRISSAMPDKPADYKGDSEILAVAEAQAKASSESGDDESDDGWVVPVIITITILVLAGAGVGGFFLYKRMKANQMNS